ncbi:MAG: lamin tail domain-containing protein [Saprospiraceae bacterium]|nr:lamin tail domain-containing protein [Saprospiraceae bacterium]
MKKRLFYIFYFFLPVALYGQFPLHFDQSPPPFGPLWQGDTALFAATSGTLQLNNPQAESSNDHYLSIFAPTGLQSPTTWRLTFNLDFNPSGSNYAEWMLRGNSASPKEASKAYIIRIGGVSGSSDAIQLFRQDGNNRTLLITGQAGAVANSPNGTVQVVQETNGQWTLFADYSGSGQFITEGSIIDTTYTEGLFSGIRCVYTATRNNAFAFDNWDINPINQDLTPPDLISAEPITDQSIQLTFSEPIQQSQETNMPTYHIEPNNDITEVSFPAGNQVILSLANKLVNTTTYTITAENVTDLSQNQSGLLTAQFTYLVGERPAIGQIYLSEFFANPATNISGLPPEEFIELYNGSDAFLELSNLAIRSGSTPVQLPAFIIGPKGFVTLVHTGNANGFPPGNTLEVPNLPGLSNMGDNIILEDENGVIFESLTYDRSWFNTSSAQSGLATLERIQFDLSADCSGNWQGSTSVFGGTPGSTNSVHGVPVETSPPTVKSVSVLSDIELLVTFSERVDPVSATQSSAYSIAQNISIEAVSATEGGFLLLLAEPLAPGIQYTLSINHIADCLGNIMTEATSVLFGIPEQPEPGDLLINEILFHPQIGGKDFIELFNASNKIISIAGLTIRNNAKQSGSIQTTIESLKLIFPGQYVALTESVDDLYQKYIIPDSAILVENDLPAFDSEEGNATLLSGAVTLDAVDYTANWHNKLLENERGVSLERISSVLPTQSSGNWTSAAADSGVATPGFKNSQSVSPVASSSDIFQISNPTFSPDGDGQDDILRLDYETEQSGIVANIQVFDESGRPIKTLARNQLLGTAGRVIWDGTNEQGEAGRTGIYIIWIELILPEGNTAQQKELCVLARRFQ